jgi:hypothetical protein
MCLLGVGAQEFSTKLEGRVFSKDADVAATHVSNISSKKGTITDAGGFFTILVKLNDTLVFLLFSTNKKKWSFFLEELPMDFLAYVLLIFDQLLPMK